MVETEDNIGKEKENQETFEIKKETLNHIQDILLTQIQNKKTITNAKQLPIENDKKEKIELKLSKDDNSLENILSDLKISGRYHLKFLFLIAILSFVSSSLSSNYIFSAENVDYKCKYRNCRSIALSNMGENSTIDYKCHKYDVFDDNGTCTEENFDTTSVMDCTEWEYEKSDSFMAEFNLGCQDWKRTLVGTVHSIGFMIGLLFVGPLSDKFGRKKVIIFNSVCAGIIGVSKSMVTSYWLFIALETLEPFLGDNYAATFTMAIETVTKKHRHIVILALALSNSAGTIFMAVLAYLAPNWRTFLFFLYAPVMLVILYMFCLDESLRWLLINGKKKHAEHIIRNAAKMNRITIDESKIVNLHCQKNSSAGWGPSLKITFSSKKLLIRFVISVCLWFTALYNSYSLLINSVSLEGNKYLNFGLVCLSDTVAGFMLLYILTKFQRKGPLIIALTLTGLFCIGQSFVPKDYRWLSTLLYICGKVNSCITIKMTYLYTTELFPTYTRNTMLALCSSLGRIGAIIAPLTPLLLKYWSGLPSFLVGILSLLTASVVTFMPDTSEDALPDDVEQAEAVGKKQKEKQIKSHI